MILLAFAVPFGEAEAQAESTPPAGTVAAEMQARQQTAQGNGGLIDVTAVTSTLVAFDRDGQPVLDLRPDELMVLEDPEGPMSVAAPGEAAAWSRPRSLMVTLNASKHTESMLWASSKTTSSQLRH